MGEKISYTAAAPHCAECCNLKRSALRSIYIETQCKMKQAFTVTFHAEELRPKHYNLFYINYYSIVVGGKIILSL